MKIENARILHCHGVAEYMYYHAGYIDRDADKMYVLGLLHDIGYLNGKAEHEFYGAELIRNTFDVDSQDIVAKCIFYHGTTPNKYMELHMCSKEDIPSELILLWQADMVVESSGENAGKIVGYNRRLKGIEDRYGIDSDAYRTCKETIDWLRQNSTIL